MNERDPVRIGQGEMQVEADVLVLGGGPAGTWAALAALESRATVVLADKGYHAECTGTKTTCLSTRRSSGVC
jgi:pyruvate/2-oxoglutarate dehydrogenase complex dihydrolipoamide dehydrogenase (E3) component